MNRLLVLVAEDNCLIARAAQLSLREFKIIVDVAKNGEEAVAATRVRNYALVLMDVEMPVMDGVSATQQIRLDEQKSGNRIPIIGVTSIDNPRSIISCGMDDCVPKPADYPALLRAWLRLE